MGGEGGGGAARSLLWTTPRGRARERVHYGSLGVEELGHVYEALLELEPGIAPSPMARLRRAKFEVVCRSKASRYRIIVTDGDGNARDVRGGHQPGRFYSARRHSAERRADPTTHRMRSFVSWSARHSRRKYCQRSPDADPDPLAILALKVVDPATGSGHFLVEACRYLGEALYAACRMCDELGDSGGRRAAARSAPTAPPALLARAAVLRRRSADCLIRMDCCLRICQVARPRVGRAVYLSRAHWRCADDWLRCIACTAWTAMRWRSNWQRCRYGWSPMRRDCR